MVIDTESHLFYWARNSHTNPQETIRRHYTWHEHNADLFVAEMDHAGVDKAFLISYDGEDTRFAAQVAGFDMEDFAGGKKYCLREIAKYPDRFYWYSVIKDARLYDTKELIHMDLERGARGFKLFPAFIAADLSSDFWLDIFRYMQEQKSTLLISYEFLLPPKTLTIEGYLAQLDKMLDEITEMPVALLHAGCIDPLLPKSQLVIDLVKKHSNLYLSNAMPGAVWDDGCEYPFANLQARVKRLKEAVGADRLMYATDWPWFEDEMKYKQNIDCFRLHAPYFTKEELDMFLGGTAKKFVGD